MQIGIQKYVQIFGSLFSALLIVVSEHFTYTDWDVVVL